MGSFDETKGQTEDDEDSSFVIRLLNGEDNGLRRSRRQHDTSCFEQLGMSEAER